MYDILFARVFFIVWTMLLITAWAAYMNKNPDTSKMWWGIIILVFALLFWIMFFSHIFPLNLILVWLFSAAMGWMISPAIKSMWDRYKVKQFLKLRGIVLKEWDVLSESQLKDLDEYLGENRSNEKWNEIVSQAMWATALAVIITASIVYISDIDFWFLGLFLFIALIVLIIMWLLNIFFFKSRVFSLVKAYFWVMIFTLYLIYDFNTLEKMAWDDTWWTAIDIAVNIYLDIVNLFLYLLEIMSES